MDEVTRLLETLKLIDFCDNLEENKIDGPTLMYCKSEDDVKELGIDITAKARMLYEEIVKFKSNGVPLALFSKVPVIINFDDLTSDDGAIKIAEGLKYKDNLLRVLNLSSNNIDNGVAIKIEEKLRFNHNLQELNLSSNNIGKDDKKLMVSICITIWFFTVQYILPLLKKSTRFKMLHHCRYILHVKQMILRGYNN